MSRRSVRQPEIVKRERKLNHTVLANELERILDDANGSPRAAKTFFTTLSAQQRKSAEG
jgi:hypothetical protein